MSIVLIVSLIAGIVISMMAGRRVSHGGRGGGRAGRDGGRGGGRAGHDGGRGRGQAGRDGGRERTHDLATGGDRGNEDPGHNEDFGHDEDFNEDTMDEDHDEAQAHGDGQGEGHGNDNTDDNIEQQVVLPQNHRGRGYSPGLFGSIPNKPIVTRIANNEIESGPASRTLLAIMRRFWRDDVVSQTDIDRLHPGWWDLVLTEFEQYFAYDPAFATQENARDSIMHHIRNNVRKIINCEKTRADKKIRENGGKYEDYRPAYLREGVWRNFCSWWRTEQFRKRSVAARGCRGKVKIPHTSGSYSFERRRRDYVVKNKMEPSLLEHFKELHTLRENGALISPEAKEIMDRYEKICANENIDPANTNLELWVKAVGGVRKNKNLGYPRIRACDVLGNTRSARRVGEGGSGRSTMERLRDDLFMRAVDRTIERAREHPEEFALSPDEVRLLARDLLDGEAELPQDHPLTEQAQRQLIHVIIEVLNDMYKRNGPNNKGKAAVDDDDADDPRDDDHDADDPRDDGAGPSNSRMSRISGGPVIRG